MNADQAKHRADIHRTNALVAARAWLYESRKGYRLLVRVLNRIDDAVERGEYEIKVKARLDRYRLQALMEDLKKRGYWVYQNPYSLEIWVRWSRRWWEPANAVTDAERAEVAGYTFTKALKDLAECYRLAGGDPGAEEDWRLARKAVAEVRRLREERDGLETEVLERRG